MIKSLKTLFFLIIFVLLGSKTMFAQTSIFWEPVLGTDGSNPPNSATAIAVDTNNGNLWVADNRGVVYLYDGTIWTRKTNNIVGQISSMALAPNGDIYGCFGYGSGKGMLYKLVKGGTSWELVFTDDNLAYSSINAILITGSADNYKVYFGTSRFGFYRPDGNGSWEQANNGLYDYGGVFGTIAIPIQSLALSADGTTLYAGTDSGIYRSTDGGDNWTLVADRLNGRKIYGIAVVDNNTIIVYSLLQI